jgi:D-alanyl-D-alanine carboxypeptidase (penicillin-binding protein 5/6)
MNERAQSLGLQNTHFANPAGLDHPEQYASARDLGWLTMAALKDERFASIVRTRNIRVSSLEGQHYDLRNTNEMLHYNEDVFGVKTGTTDRAGECLIVLFHEHDHPYLLILLGSKDRYTDGLSVMEAVHDASK